jgi:hypothetical protein
VRVSNATIASDTTIFLQNHQFTSKPTYFLCSKMPSNADHEEEKVQAALRLMKSNPGMKAAEAARQTRASYERVRRQLRGVPPSSSRGGLNKKLAEPESRALREHLLMCHSMGKSACIDNIIASANSILWCIGSDETVSRR